MQSLSPPVGTVRNSEPVDLVMLALEMPQPALLLLPQATFCCALGPQVDIYAEERKYSLTI